MKPKRKSIDQFANDDDPEIREVLADIKAAKSEGRLKLPPRSVHAVKTVEDLCRYVFHRLRVSGRYQVRIEEGHARVWVWCGPDFDDSVVGVVECVAPALLDSPDLQELRLVATRVSVEGGKRLGCIFPSARITVFTKQDDEKNWRWSQAYYNGQQNDDWEAEAIARVAIRESGYTSTKLRHEKK